MRQQRNSALLILCILTMLILSNCGGSDQQNNNASPAASAVDPTLVVTSTSLSVVNTNNGKSIWSISPQTSNDISPLVAVSANHAYYTTSDLNAPHIVAIDLNHGKQLWSDPLSGSVVSLQASSALVYVLTNSGLLSAFDATSGTLKWHSSNIGEDITSNEGKNSFILNDTSIYTEVSNVVTALDATTGSQLWQFNPSIPQDPNTGPEVNDLTLSIDSKTLLVKYVFNSTQGSYGLYAVHTDSHSEAWHLDPIATVNSDFGTNTYHDMYGLPWFTTTPDNHVLVAAHFAQSGVDDTSKLPPDGYYYLALSDGSEVWSIPVSQQDQADSEGSGHSLLVGNSAYYAIGGPSGGDISATSLSSHQQLWNTPSSGSYRSLFLDNNVLLAWDGNSGSSSGSTLTAFNVQNGKQLWQQQIQTIKSIFTLGKHVFVWQSGQTVTDSIAVALDLENGHKLWTMPLPYRSMSTAGVLENVLQLKD